MRTDPLPRGWTRRLGGAGQCLRKSVNHYRGLGHPWQSQGAADLSVLPIRASDEKKSVS
jgi:hypothetical protein